MAARPVGLPNGQRVESTIMGSAYINSSLSLSRVLYVPSLTCSLLSVSQLASDRDFVFEFAKNSCFIQDRSLKTTIGVGELRDGLYWIRACAPSTDIHQVSALGSRDLWHRRLRHPSDQVVKTIPFASTLNFNKDWVCDVCHLAKQHRSSFCNNEQRALSIFDLIHCDLWGPYRIPSSCGAKQSYMGEVAGPATAKTGQGLDTAGPAMGDTGHGPDTADTLDNGSEDMVTGSASNSVEHNFQNADDNMGTPYDLANYINYNSFSEQHRSFIAAITSGVEPPSFKEAIRDIGWCEAMKAEIDALERNEIWELTDLPVDKKALGCRWVYKIKYKSDGTFERLKARLVVFGNHQVEGLDYGETFSPVVKMVTIRAS
ncbi:uncharacterized protein LOC141628326 [Silene latifolia]|uniref:uncharacterized protein LOC141628326 n=1 Tax=Silene latifolia TaxID=37657 RepID=UPI003D782E57